MFRIDQVLANWRDVGQQTQPAKGIGSLEGGKRSFRNALPTDAVKAIASGDDAAFEPSLDAVLCEGDARCVDVEVGRGGFN